MGGITGLSNHLRYQDHSKIPDAAYTFDEAIGDLAGVMDTSDVSRATLSGNSFGIHAPVNRHNAEPSRAAIANTIGTDHMFVVKGASPSVFIDKQPEFFEVVGRVMR